MPRVASISLVIVAQMFGAVFKGMWFYVPFCRCV